MLSRLQIQNYAIIEELDINFGQHLNVITGETGAGKSILVGALNLILGQRADSTMLMQENKKCIVEGWFTVDAGDPIREFFSANDLDLEEEIVVRREITANAKSRGFINDTPVNLSQLRALSILLVDLHQQFDTLDLGTEQFQREVLDSYSGNLASMKAFREMFARYALAKNDLELLKQQQDDANKELDYNRFLFDELNDIGLKDDELELLDAELIVLNNAENIKSQLQLIYFELEETDRPIVQQLKSLQNKLKGLEQLHPNISVITKRVEAAVIELKDVSGELQHMESIIMHDPARIEWINDRISAGYRLQKKHNVKTTRGLLDIKDTLEQKLDDILNISASIEKHTAEVKKLEEACMVIAKQIAENRTKHIKPLTDKVDLLLAQVGMPNAKLKIELYPVQLSANGINTVAFLFDANKSGHFEPLSKVASGGELSRLMLCVKSLVAQKLQMPTLIFDEIDTGISGEAAKQVGVIMKNLSLSHQLIAITHQPQIAAKADAHYFVYKEIKEEKIVTAIRRLNDDERITIIAKMLSGERPTAAAIENAREMVGN